jgi:hypothetical protein
MCRFADEMDRRLNVRMEEDVLMCICADVQMGWRQMSG